MVKVYNIFLENRVRALMKTHTIMFLIIMFGIGFIVIAGCVTPANSETFPVTAADTIVPIGDILENPESYNGTIVLISGKVVNECGSGCWFFLNDSTGTIYIDLLPNNFAIPPMVGAKVTVKGTILVAGKDVSMLGRSVITDLKVYS